MSVQFSHCSVPSACNNPVAGWAGNDLSKVTVRTWSAANEEDSGGEGKRGMIREGEEKPEVRDRWVVVGKGK